MLQQEVDLLKSMIDTENQVVSARKIQVIDDEGIQRAVLSITLPVEGNPHISPILAFMDARGQKRVYFMYSDEYDIGLIGWFNASAPLEPFNVRVDELKRAR